MRIADDHRIVQAVAVDLHVPGSALLEKVADILLIAAMQDFVNTAHERGAGGAAPPLGAMLLP